MFTGHIAHVTDSTSIPPKTVLRRLQARGSSAEIAHSLSIPPLTRTHTPSLRSHVFVLRLTSWPQLRAAEQLSLPTQLSTLPRAQRWLQAQRTRSASAELVRSPVTLRPVALPQRLKGRSQGSCARVPISRKGCIQHRTRNTLASDTHVACSSLSQCLFFITMHAHCRKALRTNALFRPVAE